MEAGLKPIQWCAALVMMAAMCVAQAQPQGVTPSSRVDFGTLCGLKDTSPQIAKQFVRSAAGKWSVAEKRSVTGDNMAARVWHQGNWMVDLHDAPPQTPAVIHTGQFCFDPQGRITHMIDRYMEMAQCRCMRFTSLSFAPDGKETREVRFVDAMSGQEIQEPPAAAKGLPAAWQFRRLDELPFYSLLKK
jgi:hypothetical protein